MVPSLVANPRFCVPFFKKNTIIMTGKPTHTASKEMVLLSPGSNYCLKSEVSITLRYQLLYLQPVTWYYK